MRTFFAIAAVLLTIACKPPKEAEAPAAETGGGTINYVDEVAALPQQARDAVFFRAIRDAGLPCQRIIESRQMPDAAPPAAAWRAQCEDKAYHLIQIQPNGSAIVASRTNP